MSSAKFDGLADTYHSHRPRYPVPLIKTIARKLDTSRAARIIDAGVGTGIFLDGLLRIIGDRHEITGVDISADMINAGKTEHGFRSVNWVLSDFLTYVKNAREVDLIVFAQSYHWMDRATTLHACRKALRPEGIVAVIDNNRDYTNSQFLASYEAILEKYNDGYRRDYRTYDIISELKAVFPEVGCVFTREFTQWTMPMPATAFEQFVRSSTQAQTALSNEPRRFTGEISELVSRFQKDGRVEILYTASLFIAQLGNVASPI